MSVRQRQRCHSLSNGSEEANGNEADTGPGPEAEPEELDWDSYSTTLEHRLAAVGNWYQRWIGKVAQMLLKWTNSNARQSISSAVLWICTLLPYCSRSLTRLAFPAYTLTKTEKTSYYGSPASSSVVYIHKSRHTTISSRYWVFIQDNTVRRRVPSLLLDSCWLSSPVFGRTGLSGQLSAALPQLYILIQVQTNRARLLLTWGTMNLICGITHSKLPFVWTNWLCSS